MNCTELESIFADYLDGTLAAGERAALELHAAECAACATFMAEVTNGANLLKHLEPVEPPPALITRIAYQAPLGRVRDPFERQTLWSRLVTKWLQPVLQPRLVMGMAMTVLSFTMLERCTGVKVQRVQAADLNPVRVLDGMEDKAVRLKDRVLKYYENLRVVYEVEARLRDIERQQEISDKASLTPRGSSKPSGATAPQAPAEKDKK
jgi:anti-sigma-K factor RskA